MRPVIITPLALAALLETHSYALLEEFGYKRLDEEDRRIVEFLSVTHMEALCD